MLLCFKQCRGQIQLCQRRMNRLVYNRSQVVNNGGSPNFKELLFYKKQNLGSRSLCLKKLLTFMQNSNWILAYCKKWCLGAWFGKLNQKVRVVECDSKLGYCVFHIRTLF